MPKVTSFQLEHHTVCPRIRVIDPLEELERRGRWQLEKAVWQTEKGELTVIFRPDEIDVALFQRHFSLEQQNEVFRQVMNREIPIIFDIDDDFLNVPKEHPHSAQLEKIRPNMLKLLSIADCVTVTTEGLRDLYSPFCGRVEIIRNTLDPLKWTNPRRRTTGGPLILGYSGSSTHVEDLMMIEKVLVDLLNAHGGAVELHLWGCSTESLKAHPHVRMMGAFMGDYHGYIRSIQSEPMDIALAPLLPHPFNMSKSAMKWKEYAAGGVPALFSRIPAYERVVEQGVTGFICDTPAQWRETLATLVADAGLRKRVGEEALRRVFADYNMDAAADRWGEILESVHVEGPKVKRQGPFASIIIPVFNRCELTAKCLESVFKNTAGNFEVLVVDNASTDATPELLQHWQSQIRAIRSRTNLGFAAANNLAAELTVGEVLVMLNNDTEVYPGWLEALLKCQEETRAALVGARLFYPDGSIQHAGVAFFPHDKKPHALYAGLPATHAAMESMTGNRREFQCVTAACWLVTEKAWKEAGGFDEGFVNGYEDVDFCLRLTEKGGRIYYEPSAKVTHHESQTPGRGLHSAANEERLFTRWRSKWVEDLNFFLADDRLSFDPASGYTSCEGLLESNLKALATRNPELARATNQTRIGFSRNRIEFVVEGPSIRVKIPGASVLLNSTRDPGREAVKLAEQLLSQQSTEDLRLFGFGLGFMAEALLERMGSGDRVRVRIEDPFVFRLALENRDLAQVLQDQRLTFDGGLDPSKAFWLPSLRRLTG